MLTYLIQCDVTKLVKIGRSWNPDERIKQLQIGAATRLRLIRVVATSERALHGRFAAARTHGEWFRLSDDDVEGCGEPVYWMERERLYARRDRARKRFID